MSDTSKTRHKSEAKVPSQSSLMSTWRAGAPPPRYAKQLPSPSHASKAEGVLVNEDRKWKKKSISKPKLNVTRPTQRRFSDHLHHSERSLSFPGILSQTSTPPGSPIPVDGHHVSDLDDDSQALLLSPSPSTILQKGGSDPFSSTPILITPEARDLLDVCRAFYTHTVYPEGNAAIQAFAAAGWIDVLRHAMTESYQMFAMLACAAAFRSIVDRAQSQKWQMQSLEHRTSSMAILRQRVEINTVDLGTLNAIVHLAPAEFISGSKGNAATHMKAVKSILATIGSTNVLPQAQKQILMLTDVRSAHWLEQETVFPPEAWDPGSWQYFVSTSIDPLINSAEHISVEQLVHPSIEDLDMQMHLRSMREVLAVNRAFEHCQDACTRRNVAMWIHFRKTALQVHFDNKVAKFKKWAARVADPNESLRLEITMILSRALICCFGIMIRVTSQFWGIGPPYHLLQNDLLRVGGLLEQQGVLGRHCDELMLWLTFLCAVGEEVLQTPTEQRVFTVKFLKRVKAMRLSTHMLETLFEQFLYEPGMLAMCLDRTLAMQAIYLANPRHSQMGDVATREFGPS